MKAMNSRCWSLALNLLLVWLLGGWLCAEEIGDHPDVAAPAADGSSSEISASDAADPPSAAEPIEQETTEGGSPAAMAPAESSALEPSESSALEPTEPSAMEPAALPTEAELEPAETPMPEEGAADPNRVITPLPAGMEGLNSTPRLMPAKRKTAIEAMSWHAVLPGVSTKENLIAAWGEPAEVRKVNGAVAFSYRMKDASRMTVTLSSDVVSTILIQTDKPLEPQAIATAFGVEKISSVQVADEDGQILGEAFPERGLLFGYAPESDPVRVSQVILEVPDAQPFLLRAEAELESDYAGCLADANCALQLDPRSAAAQAMRARVYRQAGDLNAALQAAEAAVALEPSEAEWHLILAKILVQLSDFARARQHLQEVLQGSSDPLARAGAHLLMGDALAFSLGNGYAAAVKEHQEAIRLAKPLIDDPRARRRRKACELLVDAHLHVAYSVGWGHFQHKTEAVSKWLDGASALCNSLVGQQVLRPEITLRVNEQALAALAGLADPPDPSKWENAAIEQAKALIEETTDPLRARQIEWQLGLALCDAVQIEQARQKYDRALEVGQLAFNHLKHADAAGRQLPNHDFLLGQLFYRMGVIHALDRQDHEKALVWYGQAVKMLEAPVPASHVTEPGRHGETFVSIAVSYWEAGEQDEAMRLTRQGVKLMEQAVEEGTLAKAALAVPYGNLANMYTVLGDPQRANEFAALAAKFQPDKQ